MFSQVKPALTITGWVLEKIGTNEKGVKDVEVLVQGFGERPQKQITKENGSFTFKATDSNTEIKIDIPGNKYAILDPRDGNVKFSKKRNTIILVVNRNSDSDLFKKIKSLNMKVEQLAISNSRKDALFNIARDTILDLREKNKDLLLQKDMLTTSLNRYIATDREKSDSIKLILTKLETAQDKIENLQNQVYKLLEEKYLKQQSFQDRIIADLERYLLSAKDMQYQVTQMNVYIKTNQFYSYHQVSKTYNQVYPNIKENHRSMINGVERYWENKKLAQELEQVYKYLIEFVHEKIIMKEFNEMNSYIKLSKMKKVKVKAIFIESELPPVISILQDRVNQITKQLNQTE